MANPGTVQVKVDSNAIDSMFHGTGKVHIFARNFARKAVILSHVTYAKRGIGRRSGRLDAATQSGGTPLEGRYRVRTSINNGTPYAAAVHDGTAGQVITPKMAAAMPIPIVRGSWGAVKRFPVGPTFKKKWVKGQKAKPWIADAVEAARLSL